MATAKIEVSPCTGSFRWQAKVTLNGKSTMAYADTAWGIAGAARRAAKALKRAQQSDGYAYEIEV